MTTGRDNPSERQDVVASGDGSASQRLRETEVAAAVSRRGVLWRTGLATAAGAAALTALDQRQAQAATGGNFILGMPNGTTSTTLLSADTGTLQPMMKFDGTGLDATSTAVEVDSPAGGTGLQVNQSGTTGIALSVSAASIQSTALSVNGRTTFSRSGLTNILQGTSSRVVNVAGMTAKSLVLATLQTAIAGIYVTAAVPGNGKFTVYLNGNTPVTARFAWFVLN